MNCCTISCRQNDNGGALLLLYVLLDSLLLVNNLPAHRRVSALAILLAQHCVAAVETRPTTAVDHNPGPTMPSFYQAASCRTFSTIPKQSLGVVVKRAVNKNNIRHSSSCTSRHGGDYTANKRQWTLSWRSYCEKASGSTHTPHCSLLSLFNLARAEYHAYPCSRQARLHLPCTSWPAFRPTALA